MEKYNVAVKTDTLSVDVWSDVVCPFCYLGSRRLARAIDAFEHADAVTVHWHAFELDPRAVTQDVPLEELIAKKYATSVERIRTMNHRLEAEAAAVGLTWSLDRARPANTFGAHRLIALASTQDLGEAMGQRLFRAYFSDGLIVSDHDQLDALALEVGVEGAGDLWTSDAFSDDVRHDEERARDLDITGVPAFLIDEKFMVLGAQDPAKITEVLTRAWARRED